MELEPLTNCLLVFSEKVPAARACLASFLAASRQCLKERDQAGLNITLDMVDSAIEYTCHRDGDRVARKYLQNCQIIFSRAKYILVSWGGLRNK